VSKFFVEGNGESSLALHYKRRYYRSTMIELDQNNIVNFHLAEKMFYGRMDLQERAIALRTEGGANRIITNLKDSKDVNEPMGVVNFVAANFQLLSNNIRKAAKTGLIYANDQYLSDLKVYRAYESPYDKYETYQSMYIEQLGELLRDGDFVYANLEEFVPLIMGIFENILKSTPLTFPAFVKSKLNDIMSTGLAIEIADLKYSSDEDKIKFISGPNWEYFVNACDTYGFIVDASCPWRIVADINSDIMRTASQKLNFVSGDAIFSFLYEQASTQTLGEMHSLLAALYTAGRRKTFVVEEYCDGKIVRRRKRTRSVDYGSVLRHYTPGDLLKIYMIIRSYETGIELPPSDMKRLIELTLEGSFSNSSNKKYLSIFESILSKTFDKVGSFGYYRRVLEHRKRIAFNEQDALVIIEDYGGGY